MLERLKGDFDLAIITFFGGYSALGIFPFAVYRFAAGEYLLGMVDALIVVSILGNMAYAWISGNMRRAGLLMACFNTLGCAAITLMFGHHGLFWVFVVVVTNFFLATRRFAVALNVVLVLSVATHQAVFDSRLELISFLVTITLVGVCTFLFAKRTATQREQLEVLASRDPLTNAGNRRLMDVDLTRAARQFARDGQEYSLAMFDLDHFKRINDEHGHEAGDQVLAEFARLILRGTRKQDRLYRYGGEEFVLLMPGTDSRGAEQLLFQLQDTIRTSLRSPGGSVRVSAGVASLRAGEDWSRWLARADAALYAAKHGGRDQVVVHDRESAHSAPPSMERRRAGA